MEPKKKKGTVGAVLGILLLVGLGLFYLITAVVNLVKMQDTKHMPSNFASFPSEGEYVDVDFHLNEGEVLYVKHTINFIPSGTEHFFLIYNDQVDHAILVRSGKNFDKDFVDGVLMSGANAKGKVKSLGYKEKSEIEQNVNALIAQGVEFAMNADGDYLYIDDTMGTISWMQLLCAAALGLGAAALAILAKKSNSVPVGEKAPNTTPIAVIGVIFIVAGILGMLYTLNFVI